MMMIKAGASDQSVVIRALDTTSGLPVTTLNGAAGGLQMFYRRGFAASVGVSAITIADLTTSHTDGGLNHIHSGYYRFDPPDAAWSAGVDRVLIGGSATGVMILGQDVQLGGYNPAELTTVKIDRLLSIDGLALSALLTLGNIRQQSSDALSLLNLDHLLAVSAAGTDVVTGTVIGQLAATDGNYASFVKDTDSLQALRDRGDAAWRTADVNGLATSAVLATVLADTQAIDGLPTSAVINLANIRQQVTDGLSNIHLDHLLAVSSVDTNVADGSLFAQLATSTADFSSFNKENHSLQVLSEAGGLTTSQVRQQVSEALSAIHLDHLLAVSATAGDIANGSFFAQMSASAGSWDTFVKGTDSLESLRDRGDAAWLTADVNGLATSAVVNLVNIRQQVTDGLSLMNLDHLLAVSSVDTNVADGSLFAQLATSTADFSSFNKENHSLQTIAGAAGLTTSQVRQQVSEALSAIHLDHLLAVSSIDTNVADGSLFAQLATSTADFSSFNKEQFSLQTIAGAAGLTTSQVRQQVSEALSAIHLDHLLAVSSVDTNVADGSIFAQISTSTGDFSSFNKEQFSLQTIAGATGLTTSQVRQQVTEALSAIHLDHLLAVSATEADVADGSFFAQMSASAGSWDTFNKTTDSLEAIRNHTGWNTADVNGLATSAALAGVATNVSAIQLSLSSLEDLDGKATSAVLATVLTDTQAIDGLPTSAVINLVNIRQQVSDGLSGIHLDHLFATSATDSDLVTGSFWTQVSTSSGDWSDFVKATDSLEAIRNNTAWNTADVNGLATSLALAAVATNVSAIQLSLSSLEDLDGKATSAVLGTLVTNVSAIQLSLSSVQVVLTAASNAEQNTQNIQTRLPATLVGGRIDSNVGSIAGNESAASRQAMGASMVLPGTAITGTLTTTCMTTDLTETTNDHYNGRSIIFVSGALIYQATSIIAYNGTTKLITYATLTEAPSNGTGFIIV